MFERVVPVPPPPPSTVAVAVEDVAVLEGEAGDLPGVAVRVSVPVVTRVEVHGSVPSRVAVAAVSLAWP